MADSAVAVTAGTGTNIDTRTESTNGNHRQVVILGDPATNAGVAPVDATAGLKVNLGADNDVTVTGTVDLGATDNAVLDAIEVDTTAILADTTTIAGDTTSIDSKIPALGQALAAGSVPVVLTADQITTLTPPAAITGFATSAKQDTIIGHVDGIETLLGTIDSDTSILAGAVTASKVQVDVVSMPAGGSGLTDTELRATPVPVSGTVAVTNAGITTIAGAVSGTEMQVDVLTMPTTTVTATDLDIRPLVNTDVVTAELSAVDNAVLDTIAAKDFATQTTLAAINTKLVSGTDIGDVTINNASGASAVNIQDGGNTITVDGTVAVTNSDITSIKTAVEIIDNAVSGNEMQVDVVGALPAGTNNIGDVDVLSVPRSLSGPGQPGTAVDSYTQAAISAVTGANQSLIAAPGANKQIWVYGIGFTCSVAGTVAIQDEDDTAITGVVSYAQYSGPLVHPSGNFSMPLWKVATNKALEADVTTATINGWVNYAIISV